MTDKPSPSSLTAAAQRDPAPMPTGSTGSPSTSMHPACA